MLEIEVADERLFLLVEKAVYWPRTKTLVVADLHFGKPAAFRKSGIAVPEATTAADLERLKKILRETKSERLIILGDFFHAAAGLQPEMMQAVESWCKKNVKRKIILVPGNHDRKAGPPPECWNIQNVDEIWNAAPFSFSHEPKQVENRYVLAGHLHPAISLSEKFGPSLRAPCFCFGKQCAILPAFGSFTGMRNMEWKTGERVFAVGADEIIEVSSRFNRLRKAASR